MRLTIDTESIGHAIRRWWYRWFEQPSPGATCLDCGATLDHAERIYYGLTCERCEGIRFHAETDADGVPDTKVGSDAQ